MASPARETREITQRELLGMILGCAADGRPASFIDALHTAAEAGVGADPRALARELLTDLTIRDWVVLLREDDDGSERPVARARYEMELAADRNWDEWNDSSRIRFALTDKGRERLGPLLATLHLA